MKTQNSLLYEQVSRIGKAVASPKRLEILYLLANGEKTVEAIARELSVDIKLVSSHLKVLKEACLVISRRSGKFVIHGLAGPDVGRLWIGLRRTAEVHLLELRLTVEQLAADPGSLDAVRREDLLERARSGDVVVIDVRPQSEFEQGHLPYARSIPLEEIEARLAELPKDREIVAYCRGPYCLLSTEAMVLLRTRGFRASKILDGVNEWKQAGLPLGMAQDEAANQTR